MKYAIDLVLKVNETYHDVEEKEYENKHPEIFQHETAHWQKIGELFIASNHKKINLLDIGSGTGFVPLQIGEFLKNGDRLICSDISTNILNICKKNLSFKKFKGDIDYIKTDGKKMNLESKSFDCITINSVLHHIPDLPAFFKEMDRLQKIGGCLIIGHEPNKSFYTHKFLWNNYKFISLVFSPKEFIAEVLRKFKLYETGRKIYQNFNNEIKNHNNIVEKTNKCLMESGYIKSPLSSAQLTEIVDIHSPTAGGYHKDRGLDITQILKDYLPNFTIEYQETYDHLCQTSHKNKLTKWYDSVLKKNYPKDGSNFLVVFKKTK